MNCVILTTKDKKNFATKKSNLKSLIEYAKTFDAELRIATLDKGRLLDLEDIANYLCSPDYSENLEFSEVRLLFPKQKKNKTSAQEIKNHIRELFTEGNEVSLKYLKNKYSHLMLTDACLCNHLSAIRKEFITKGCKVKKIKAGTYRID